VGGLKSVSCVSTRFCVAVGGGAAPNGPGGPVAVVFDGTGWVPANLPVQGLEGLALASVSCASIRFCMAVGQEPHGPEGTVPDETVFRFDGQRWHLSSVRGAGEELTSVSCTSSRFCMAVGPDGGVAGAGGSVAFVFDGSRWRSTPLPESGSMHIFQVSCAADQTCIATGRDQPFGSDALTSIAVRFLDDRWSGVVGFRDLSPAMSVDCASTAFCIAVTDGEAAGPTKQGVHPVIGDATSLRFDGSSWSAVSVAGLQSAAAVSCWAIDQCLVLGNVVVHRVITSEFSRFDGSGWAISTGAPFVPSTQAGAELTGVSCVSATFCAAVGTVSTSTAPSVTTGPFPTSASPLLFTFSP
jgi:hypothetical protein